MKLGTQTGSLVNHILADATSATPEVGTGCTVLLWTDRKAATVVASFVERKRTYVTVQYDTATRTDDNGMSESQDYAYEPNPNGIKRDFELRPDGRWSERGSRGKGNGLLIGVRQAYHDYSF
jgi:hypothetical protein